MLVLKAHLWVQSSHCQKVWLWHRLAWPVFSPAGRWVSQSPHWTWPREGLTDTAWLAAFSIPLGWVPSEDVHFSVQVQPA